MTEKTDYLDVIKMFLDLHDEDPCLHAPDNLFKRSIKDAVEEIERLRKMEHMMKMADA